jgi:hypothetical protein
MSKPLPDTVCVKDNDGFALIANKQARAVINRGFEKPRPRWRGVQSPDGALSSPTYRPLVLEPGPALYAMLCALHDAGLLALYWCDNCQGLHPVDGKQASELKYRALSGAEGVMPEHKTAQ